MFRFSAALEVSPGEAQASLSAAPGDFIVLDVREPQEYAASRLPDSELVPMGSIPANLQKIEGWADDKQLLVLCHHGVRSLQVVHWLRERGVENCVSIAGGIDRWSLEVDPQIPRY